MRLGGHVPRGLTVPAAVRLGFEEIDHAAFRFSPFHQDSLHLPMRACSAVVAVVAPRVDVEGAAMTDMIALFRARGTVIDGTFNLRRSSRTVGARPDSLQQRADANYLRLLRRLYDAGVTLVAGTDGSSYNDGLELYERVADVRRVQEVMRAGRLYERQRIVDAVRPPRPADATR